MSKLTKEEFNQLVNLLEKIAPRPAFVPATDTSIDVADILIAIGNMRQNVEPPVDRIIHPWTYAILESAGVLDK